jgi:hypothetical protein
MSTGVSTKSASTLDSLLASIYSVNLGVLSVYDMVENSITTYHIFDW